MARNDKFDEQIINLITARHKGVVWELDKELVEYIKDNVTEDKLRLNNAKKAMHYNGVLLHRYTYSKDGFDRRFRSTEGDYQSVIIKLEKNQRNIVYLTLLYAISKKDFSRLSNDTILNLGMGILFDGLQDNHFTDRMNSSTLNLDSMASYIEYLPKELKELHYLKELIPPKPETIEPNKEKEKLNEQG